MLLFEVICFGFVFVGFFFLSLRHLEGSLSVNSKSVLSLFKEKLIIWLPTLLSWQGKAGALS